MQHQPQPQLPKPDAESAAHSARVGAAIRAKIAAAGGQISFAEYMHHALYAPGLGYYSAGATKFGMAGDFITAPEVSPLFARVLARQCADVIAMTDAAGILEFGAGSGRLAVDLLQALAALDALPDSYRILEVSPDLRDRQASLLRRETPEHYGRVSWLDRMPDQHTGVIVANEVLDALPVERFLRHDNGIAQLCVGIDHDEFVLQQRSAPQVLRDAVVELEARLGQPLPHGYASEICLAAPHWVADLADVLQQGIAFLFDYGLCRREYYGPGRSGGWLRCHFRHHAHDNPLLLPGIQDITGWVDFSAVADAAHAHGLDIAGFVTQAHFLIAGGLEEALADLAKVPLHAQLELSRQAKLLTLPGEMGENFKCLGLSRGAVTTPDAFLAADRTATL
ncbi:MAG: SAM-dependent methyltransferase [Gammaproteobacteria bacterium]|nr:SAM-dependent methyltransferase [Gammaproteobacteria bacterium]